MFRFKDEIVKNCMDIWDKGIAIDEHKYKCLVYYYCSQLQVNLNPNTRVPRTTIDNKACMTKLEWETFEYVLTECLAELQLLKGIGIL